MFGCCWLGQLKRSNFFSFRHSLQLTRLEGGPFYPLFFLCPLPCLRHSFSYPVFSIFFLSTFQTQKAIGCMCELLFTRNIYSLLMIIFASFKNCSLRTLWPISSLPEIMFFPYYLYGKLTSRRQSTLSRIRVANPDASSETQGQIVGLRGWPWRSWPWSRGRKPFFVPTVLNS